MNGRRFAQRTWACLLLASLGSGCAVPLSQACPACRTLTLGERPSVPTGTQTVFLLVPGMLGYGWEWDDVQKELQALPGAVTMVWPWDPWLSLERSGEGLVRHVDYLLRRLPRSVEKVVVIGHSAAGLLLMWAASRIQVPPQLAVELISIGAPLSGQGFNPWGGHDLRQTPLPIALGSTFSPWPEPAERVSVRVFVTGPSDPVMTPRFGHNPGDRKVLPHAAEAIDVPTKLDHNYALGYLAKQLRELAAAQTKEPAGKPVWPKSSQ